MNKQHLGSKITIKIFRLIFYICAVFFLLMAAGMIFFPHFLLRGTLGNNANPVIIGMFRGAGGSIAPYSVLYYLAARRPFKLKWAFYIIALANVFAIILDLSSVFLGEYKFSNAMIDLPFEVLSLVGVTLFWTKIRFMNEDERKLYK